MVFSRTSHASGYRSGTSVVHRVTHRSSFRWSPWPPPRQPAPPGTVVGAPRHNAPVLLNDVARVSAEVARVPGRRATIDLIADLLRACCARLRHDQACGAHLQHDQAEGAEVELVVAFLSGELRQRQIGVGYA